MADYRLFFLGSDGAIEARHDFCAPDDEAALQITAVIGKATADAHHGVMLWQGTRRIFELSETGPADCARLASLEDVSAAALAADTQQRVVECEEALLSSHWRVAKSRMLVDATTSMRDGLRERQAAKAYPGAKAKSLHS